MPWFAGLALVSWLCDPNKHPHAFSWVFLINLGLSAVIYMLALRSRQPREASERHLAGATAEAGEFAIQWFAIGRAHRRRPAARHP